MGLTVQLDDLVDAQGSFRRAGTAMPPVLLTASTANFEAQHEAMASLSTSSRSKTGLDVGVDPASQRCRVT